MLQITDFLDYIPSVICAMSMCDLFMLQSHWWKRCLETTTQPKLFQPLIFDLVTFKESLKSTSTATCSQLLSSEGLWCVKTKILWSQSAIILWLNEVELVVTCNLFGIILQITNRLVKIANRLPSTYTEIQFKYLHSESNQNLKDLRQKFWTFSTNSDVIAEDWFNCKMTRSETSLLHRTRTHQLRGAETDSDLCACVSNLSMSSTKHRLFQPFANLYNKLLF